MTDIDTQRPVESVRQTAISHVAVLAGGLVVESFDEGCQLLEDGAVVFSAETIHKIAAGLVLGESVVIRPSVGTVDQIAPKEEAEKAPRLCSFNEAISIDLSKDQVYIDEKPLHFPVRELDVLALLMQNEGRVVSRVESYDRVWGVGKERLKDRTLDVHIRRIREKLGEYSWMVITKRDQGHMFSSASDPADYQLAKKQDPKSIQTGYVTAEMNQEAMELVLSGNKVVIDFARHGLIVNGEAIELVARDYNLLNYFVLNKGLTISTMQIAEAMEGVLHITPGGVRIRVARIRKLLGPASGAVKTVRGTGYIFDA